MNTTAVVDALKVSGTTEGQGQREVITKPTTTNPVTIAPADAHAAMAKHMLVDGFDLIVDLRKSQGSYLFDSRSNKRYLDFFTFFASGSVGMNHPKMTTPAFLEKLAYTAVNKP